VGKVTSHLHNMQARTNHGCPGPHGEQLPWDVLEGKNVVIIGGGFAFTTLRSSIIYMLDPANRGRFGDIQVVYGARMPGLLLYKDELAAWEQRDDIKMHITVTEPMTPTEVQCGLRADRHQGEGSQCGKLLRHHLRPAHHDQVHPACAHRARVPPERIISSLEMRMKCGIGICGRCNIGTEYVCKDGPVFTLAQLSQLPNEY